MHEERSRELYGRALSVFPGGVNSPVRAIRPYPFFINRGDGAHVIDVDGNRYIDYVLGYGPLLLGHTLPEPVVGAIQSRVADGPMYGAPTEVEIELAEFIARHVPSVEQLRFVNSGTEATNTAVRLARGYTGRDTIVIVGGGYHGAQESTLVTGEPGERAVPDSAGIPDSFAHHTITVPFNDSDALERVFEANPNEIAGVMVEPILGNAGCVLPIDGYLDRVRELTSAHGALLIFDEVMTGFRIGGLRCAQGAYGVTPDLTTFAKVIGGGFPVGAVGGQRSVMRSLKPTGDVFHASTYAGHPVSVVAGLEMLKYAAKHDVYDHLCTLGDTLRSGLSDILEDEAPSYTVVGRDSMFKVIFSTESGAAPDADCHAGCRQDPTCSRYDGCPKNAGDIANADTERWERLFWQEMKEEGVFLTANQFESQFLSYAHTEEDIENTLEAYKAVI